MIKLTKFVLPNDIGHIKNIFCGGFHVILMNEDNEIYVFGLNRYYFGIKDSTDYLSCSKVSIPVIKDKKSDNYIFFPMLKSTILYE